MGFFTKRERGGTEDALGEESLRELTLHDHEIEGVASPEFSKPTQKLIEELKDRLVIEDPEGRGQLEILMANRDAKNGDIIFQGNYSRGSENEGTQYIMELIAATISDKRVFFVSPPGFGETSKFRVFTEGLPEDEVEKRGFEELAASQLRALQEAFNIDNITLLGMSMGALTSAKLALEAERAGMKVDNLVLMAGPADPIDTKVLRKRFASDMSKYQEVRKGSHDPRIDDRGVIWSNLKMVANWLFVQIPRGEAGAMLKAGAMIAGNDLNRDLVEIGRRGIKTTVITGTHDPVAPSGAFKESIKEINEQGGNIRRIILPGETHATLMEIKKQMASFLRATGDHHRLFDSQKEEETLDLTVEEIKKGEELPQEPQFGLRDNLAAKVAGMNTGELTLFRKRIMGMDPQEAARYGRGVLKGKGVLGGGDGAVKERLIETLEEYVGGLERTREAQLDEIVATAAFVKKFKEEGYKNIEEWIVNMSPEELMRVQYAYLAGKGSRSAEDIEQIRAYMLEAAAKLAEGAKEERGEDSFGRKLMRKLSGVKVFGKSLSEFAAGAVTGGAARRGLRFALMGVGGFIPAAIAGAGGGSIAAIARGYFSERRAYKNLLKDMSGGKARLEDIEVEDIYTRLDEWKERMDKAEHPRTIERLMDERRYLLMALRKKMKAESGDPEELISSLVGIEYSGGVEGSEVEEVEPLNKDAARLLTEMREAKLMDRHHLGRAVLRGALIGAVGGVVGGLVMDRIFDGGNSTLEEAMAKARGPVVGGGAGVGAGDIFSPEANRLPNIPPGVGAAETSAIGHPEVSVYVPLEGEVAAVELATNQSVDDYVRSYFEDVLGREPNVLEYQAAALEFMEDNNLTLVDMYQPAGQIEALADSRLVDLSGVNEVTHGIIAGIPIEETTDNLILSIESLPDQVALPDGSNPWLESRDWMKEVLGREPTSREIVIIDRIVCEDSDIAWPEAGIEGSVNDHAIPPGHIFNFERAKSALVEMATKSEL